MRVKAGWVRNCRSLMMATSFWISSLFFSPPSQQVTPFSLDNTRLTDNYDNDKILFDIIMKNTKFRLPCSKFVFWVVVPTALANITQVIKDYHALREELFRTDVKWFWMYERYPLTLASQESTNLPYDATQLRLICNKPTLLYWAHSALDRDSFQAFSFAGIYTEWFRAL